MLASPHRAMQVSTALRFLLTGPCPILRTAQATLQRVRAARPSKAPLVQPRRLAASAGAAVSHQRSNPGRAAAMAQGNYAGKQQQQQQQQQENGSPPPRRPSLWWKDRPAYRCPACGQRCYRVPAFETHILRCCPDVAQPEEWHQLLAEADAQEQLRLAAPPPAEQAHGDASPFRPHHADAAIRAWLTVVQQREEEQRERALDIAFRQRDAAGQPLRQGAPEIAAALGLSPARAQRLLAAAKRAVPLAVDYEPVEVLYEDEDLVAVNKPCGVITAPKHRFTGGSMVNRIIGSLGYEPLTLHRLDMNTTGVVLFAKQRDIVDGVHSQFRRKTVRKEYLALAVGVPSPPTFTVDAPIDRDEDDVVARRVVQGGKPALTHFSVLSSAPGADLAAAGRQAPCSDAALAAALAGGGLSLVSCRPLTGRTHQIRVHLAHAGHAILGDDLYGATGPWISRHALHAASLTITHPRTGQPLTVTAPLPPDFREAMAQLGLSQPSKGGPTEAAQAAAGAAAGAVDAGGEATAT